MRSKLILCIVVMICLSMVPLLAGAQTTGKPDNPQKCIRSQGFANCDGECVNLRTDVDNCGSCGNACAEGYTCKRGYCVRSRPSRNCNDGNPCTTDVWSKGGCKHMPRKDGTKCGDGACYNGVCYQEYASCLASGGTVEKQSCCQSVKDFPDTCLIGACGCPPEGSKETLVCNCGEGMCFDSETGSCVPVDFPSDCPGGCPDDGDLCTVDHRCENGECVYDNTVCIALEGYRCCPQIGGCINTWWDEENCGECGNVCPAGWGCCNGVCSPTCPIEDPEPVTIPSED